MFWKILREDPFVFLLYLMVAGWVAVDIINAVKGN